MEDSFRNSQNLNLIRTCSGIALTAWVEKNILKVLSHAEAVASCSFGSSSRWWFTLFAGSGVRMFLWGQWPWKHHWADRLWTIVLSLGFWLMRGVTEEQFQQCYQEQTEGDKGPLRSRGAQSVGPGLPGCDSDSWIDSLWCGLSFCLPTCLCVLCA